MLHGPCIGLPWDFFINMEGYGEASVLYEGVRRSKRPFHGWYLIKLQEYLTQKEVLKIIAFDRN